MYSTVFRFLFAQKRLHFSGCTGKPLQVTGNYFKLCSVPDWRLYQYHVKFEPEEDRPFIRKQLLKEHKSKIGGYLFDGMILYASERFQENVSVPGPWYLFKYPHYISECK